MKQKLISIAILITLCVGSYAAYQYHLQKMDDTYLDGALAGHLSGMTFLAMVRKEHQDTNDERARKAIELSLAESLEMILHCLEGGGNLDPGLDDLATGNACAGLELARSEEPLVTPNLVKPFADKIWLKLDCPRVASTEALSEASPAP